MPPPARPSSTPGYTTPTPWRYTRFAWQLNQRLTRRHIDFILRFRSARVLPRTYRARFTAMGISDTLLDDILGDVHSVSDWSSAWVSAAQCALRDSRLHALAARQREAATDRRLAAMAYHVAQFVVTDPSTARAMRATATTLYSQALPLLMPDVQPISLPWRNAHLPGFLRLPQHSHTKAPLVVLLNGITTVKEETLLWSERFVAHGCALLALDSPGTGEARALGTTSADHDDLLDGLPELLRREPWFQPEWIAVAGISLGGAQAVRIAAADRRLVACIAVTPPFDATTWLDKLNPILRNQLASLGEATTGLPSSTQVAAFALQEPAARLRVPLLVFGAGRDLVIPPDEAIRLAASAPSVSTLVWYPATGHGLYDLIDDWTDDTASWLRGLLPSSAMIDSTQVDAVQPTDELLHH